MESNNKCTTQNFLLNIRSQAQELILQMLAVSSPVYTNLKHVYF